MFATDSFLSAEVSYRADRVRRDWGSHHRPVLSRRTKDAPNRSAR